MPTCTPPNKVGPWCLAPGLCSLLACLTPNVQADDTTLIDGTLAAPTNREPFSISIDRSEPTRYTGVRVDFGRWFNTTPTEHLGLSLGMAAQANAISPALTSQPIWDPTVGVYLRTHLSGKLHLDFSTWARAPVRSQGLDSTDAFWISRPITYGSRVEVQWASTRYGGLMPEFGAIGLRLEGNSQVVLRARSRGPMVYYRTKF